MFSFKIISRTKNTSSLIRFGRPFSSLFEGNKTIQVDEEDERLALEGMMSLLRVKESTSLFLKKFTDKRSSMQLEPSDVALPSQKLTIEGYKVLFAVLKNINSPTSTVALFRLYKAEGHELDIEQFNHLIMNLSLLGQWKRCILTLEEMRKLGLTPDVKSLVPAITSFRKTTESAKCEELVNELRKLTNNIPTNVYHVLLNCLFADGKWKKALNVFNEVIRSQRSPDPFTCALMLSNLLRLNLLTEATELESSLELNTADINISFYNERLKLYGKLGLSKKALDLYQSMKRNGPKPTAISVSLAISAMKRLKMWQEALLIFKEAKEELGIKPNERIFNPLLLVLGKCKKRKEMVDVFNEMNQMGCQADAVSYTIFFDSLLYEYDEQFFDQLLNDVRRKNITFDSMMYNAVLSIMAKFKPLQDAQFVWQQMQISRTPVNPRAFGTLLTRMIREAAWDEFDYMLSSMKASSLNLDDAIYFDLVQGLVEKGKVDQAENLLNDTNFMKKEFELRVNTSFILLLGKFGHVDRAMKVFQKLKQKGPKPDGFTYNIIISLFSTRDEWEKALEILDEMQKDGVGADLMTMRNILNAFPKGCSYHFKVFLAYATVRSMGVEPSEDCIKKLLEHFLLHPKHQNEVLQYLMGMKSAGIPFDSRLMNTLAWNSTLSPLRENFSNVREFCRNARELGIPWNASTFQTLIRSLEKSNEPEKSLLLENILDEMHELGIEVNRVIKKSLKSLRGVNSDVVKEILEKEEKDKLV